LVLLVCLLLGEMLHSICVSAKGKVHDGSQRVEFHLAKCRRPKWNQKENSSRNVPKLTNIIHWFERLFVSQLQVASPINLLTVLLGQGGLERAAQNNDQLQVQHDVPVKNLALDRSNAA
jgi:hypothetical protein